MLKEEDGKTDLEYRRKKVQLANYFKTQNLPQKLIRTIEANFEAMWTSGGKRSSNTGEVHISNTPVAYCDTEKQKQFVAELPIGLRADIYFEAHIGKSVLATV